MKLLTAALLAQCVVCLAQPEPKFASGALIVNAGKTTATLVVIDTAEVKLGEKAGEVNRSVPVLRSQKVLLSKLKAGTTIHYEAFASADGRGSFRTAPDGAQPFHFVVFGDTRSRHEHHQSVVDAIVRADPHFVLHTGDLVANGDDQEQWATFFKIERELLRRAAFFPVLGNHERNSAHFYEFFGVTLPYYSFNWGDAHFIVLDTNAGGPGTGAAARLNNQEEQKRWLEKDLEASAGAKFRFVILHHPPFTVNYEKTSHVSKFAAELVPVFEAGKVTAVFAGHDHNYQRHVKNGVTYIVTGGGGAPLAPVPKMLEGLTKKMESTQHYVSVYVEGERARIRAVALDGREIEIAELVE